MGVGVRMLSHTLSPSAEHRLALRHGWLPCPGGMELVGAAEYFWKVFHL